MRVRTHRVPPPSVAQVPKSMSKGSTVIYRLPEESMTATSASSTRKFPAVKMPLEVIYSSVKSDRRSSCSSPRPSSNHQNFRTLNYSNSKYDSKTFNKGYRFTRFTSSMSGFLSSEAERALMGEEEEARRLFYSDPLNHPPPPGHPAYQGQPGVPFVPSQRWSPSYSPGPSDLPLREGSFAAAQSSPYTTGAYSTDSRSSLHPDDADDTSSQRSRASSPGNPSDLQNFGYPLGDGLSWKCAYSGCSSQSVFTRGCDLRKHFRRHTKTLFCRYEGCSAATEGGFSSRKDRDRHEAKHRPDIPCEWRGCDRVFSRVDNMKDHVRRIHEGRP
ncbi:MAG: hypothetical protein Q9170_000454 [Blastenia crenularia]